MSGQDDTDIERRHKAPYTGHHQIPTIKRFREEKEARKAEAEDYGEHQQGAGAKEDKELDGYAAQNGHQKEGAGEEEDAEPAIDTSQVDAAATDPRARRKELKHRKDDRAEREVTDPVTHLPVKIQDLTSDELKEVPENDEPFGATTETATGVSNKKKTGKQLHAESKDLQNSHDSMRALFPPPNYDSVKQELAYINKLGVTVGLAGTAAILVLAASLEKLLKFEKFAGATLDRDKPRWITGLAIWLLFAAVTVGAIGALILGVRDWITKRIDSLWDNEIWDANGESQRASMVRETETVAWLNALLSSVWPLVNPDLFTSLADTLEDVMQASLPKVIQMVSVNDIGQGSESIRILGIKWLPTGAAARSVNADGKLATPGQSRDNDRKVPGEDEVDNTSNSQSQSGSGSGSGDKEKTEQADDGSQQQVAEGMEAEEGDFVNMEVAFAYRARSNKKSIKDRAKDMHLYMAFYLPGNLKVPVWVDLRGIVGTMRLRLQLCPDPPFFSLCTLTFLGQPKVDLSCTPLNKHAVNIMDVPLISNFVQSAVDAAMAEYVAPKSLNLDLKDMLAGDDFKKDTNARGVLVVNIKKGYDFKTGDTGIPLVKDGSSDPYVSVGWAKFGKPVWSTRLLLDEMEPWWDETAHVLVTPEELNVDEKLRVQLWDSDRLTADDDLGRIEVDLKELMKRDDSNGRMWHRTDGFRALKKDRSMPGKLEWSVGYFSKTRIQDDQLQRQTFDSEIKNLDQLKSKVDTTCQRKLREANIKEGRHKSDADELDQQKAQEMKDITNSMIISAPPPDGYPSGIFSIQIHQITGMELEKVSKAETDKAGEANDEEEEGEGLPSAYCTVIINHSKAFKTRTKPKNAKPFYNASTERYIADWKNTEVYLSVRDARVSEDDPLLGIVHLPLGEVFKHRSQINGFYPLTGGIGYGRVRLSMVWRSIQLQAPPEALGWEHGTVDVQSSVSHADVPENLRDLKLKFHTDLGSGKMYAGRHDQVWNTKNQESLKLPVRKRYSSCLAIQFRHSGMFNDKTAAFAVLWLKDIPDEEEREVTLTVWKGDYERATKNAMPECGERVGSIKLKLTFWNGLGAAHSKWASKDDNLKDVVEVLETARDNYEAMEHEEKVGTVDGNATDSSDDDEASEVDGEAHENLGKHHGNKSPVQRVKDLKKHEEGLNRSNRGLMQWKVYISRSSLISWWMANDVAVTTHCSVGRTQSRAYRVQVPRPLQTPHSSVWGRDRSVIEEAVVIACYCGFWSSVIASELSTSQLCLRKLYLDTPKDFVSSFRDLFIVDHQTPNGLLWRGGQAGYKFRLFRLSDYIRTPMCSWNDAHGGVFIGVSTPNSRVLQSVVYNMSRIFRRFASTASNYSASEAAVEILQRYGNKPISVREQIIDANQARLLSITLGRQHLHEKAPLTADGAPVDGTPIPPGYHWAYFTPTFLEKDLDKDGTNKELNPLPPFTRRMFAGGELEWKQYPPKLLRIGQNVTEITRVTSAEPKQLKSGESILAGLEKTFETDNGVALIDRRLA